MNFKRKFPRKKAKVESEWALDALIRRIKRQPQVSVDVNTEVAEYVAPPDGEFYDSYADIGCLCHDESPCPDEVSFVLEAVMDPGDPDPANW